jgi:TonB family protein
MILDWLLKPAVLIALAGVVSVVSRRAALRHFAWALAIVGLLLLPAIPAGLQVRTVEVAPVLATPLATAPGEEILVRGTAKMSWRDLIVPVWMLGMFVVALRLAPAFWKLRRLTREASEVARVGRARILEHDGVRSPFTWGFLRPVVLLPAGDRTPDVLAHELAHVRRADWLTQMLAQAACAVYWFHPLVWIAAANLRRESERACDDAVLQAGSAAPAYAERLVEIARRQQLPAAVETPVAVAMWCRNSQLEDRVKKILENRDRRGLGRLAAGMMTVAALLAIAPVATLRIQAAQQQQADGTTATLRGAVMDPSSARVPGARVRLKTASGEVTTVTGADGSFTLQAPAGKTLGFVEKMGFMRGEFDVDTTRLTTLNLTLRLGRISETVAVAGVRPATSKPAEASPAKTPTRIRVGGNVTAAKLLQKTNPEYPKDLQEQGIEGTVELEAIISKEGNILELRSKSAEGVHDRLIQAAMAAVKTWQYSPTLLNGQPVEIITTVTVRFYLQ